MKIVQRTCRGFRSLLFPAIACLLSVATTITFAQSVPPSPRYTVTNLGTLPGGDHSGAYGINNKGQIAGWSDNGGDNDSDPTHGALIHNHAVVWDKGQLQDLGLLKGFPFGAAKAINDKGQAVGGSDYHYLNGGGGMMSVETFLWQSGRITSFNISSPPAHIDDLTGINNQGEMIGEGFPNGARSRHPLLWFKGKGTDLGLLPGATEGIANGMNNKGEIVGWVMGDDAPKINGDYRAFLYKDGKMINLGDHPIGTGRGSNYFSQAYAINDEVQIVGRIGGIAALWNKGERVLLGSLPGYYQTTAYAINNSGKIVGTGESGLYQKSHAFVYQNGTMDDLNNLIPSDSGWVLTTARGINDRGQIVGSGQHDGKDRAFLLTPLKTPEGRAGFDRRYSFGRTNRQGK